MRYVIVGGVAAGMSAAMQIVRTDKNADITVLERGTDYSYGQCGLPYVINGLIPSATDVIARSVDTFRSKYGINARINSEVTHIDSKHQFVEGYYSHNQESIRFEYDRLLIATGASPKLPDWEGKNLKGTHMLKTIPNTTNIMNDLKNSVQQIVVVGGGYIGLEMAESFASIGKKVTIIQRGQQLAKVFDEDMADLIHDEAMKNGVQVVLDESVERFDGKERVNAVITNRGTYEADLVLVAAGVRPNTSFLHTTGIRTSKNGAICVNPFMETNVKNIYAAGDCATHFHIVKQKDDYIPLGTTANKQGRIAGANMAGVPTAFKGVVGTSIIKFFDLSLGKTGLSEKEARALEIPYHVQTVRAKDIAGYYPGSEPLTVKLVYSQKNNQILGGQIIGKRGVDKRIDVLATALFNNMTIHQLIDLDLAYAPPFNGVWDPIQQAARRA
ncbi:CoA-disulfide reductase [Oceanobacillus sp. CAU 1775]